MPARLRDIARAARGYDVLVEEPSSGSHWHCRKTGVRVYTIPAHNGGKTEIDDVYIRAFCRHFGLDFDELKKKL